MGKFLVQRTRNSKACANIFHSVVKQSVNLYMYLEAVNINILILL